MLVCVSQWPEPYQTDGLSPLLLMAKQHEPKVNFSAGKTVKTITGGI